jgi:hypothetical protein
VGVPHISRSEMWEGCQIYGTSTEVPGADGTNTSHGIVPAKQLLFVISLKAPLSPLSSRPKRTRISCHAALDMAACAPFRKEGRMKCINANKSHRKSGVG